MISYYYPPLTDVGCKRSVAFAKYLKKFGWEPFVLSVKNPDKTFCSVGNDPSPQGINIEYSYSVINVYKLFGKVNGILTRFTRPLGIKIKRNYFYDIFCIPDFFFGWIPLTTIKAYKLIKKLNIDIIYVSCRPFSSAVIGILIKLFTKKLLIIDFRDAYSLEETSLNWLVSRPIFRIKIDMWIEKCFLKYTDIFVTVTNSLKELYTHQYPQAKEKIFCVHNGFDVQFIPKKGPSSKYAKFTIVYAGNFYFSEINSGTFFFRALNLLKKKNVISSNNFQFLFYGDSGNMIAQISKDFGIEDLVNINSRVSYKSILNIISKSHLQLLRIAEAALGTKIFDGVSLNIPFLATNFNVDAEDIIKRYSPSSYLIKKESAENIAKAIIDAIRKYDENKIQNNHVEEFYEVFSRENLTIKLMNIINNKTIRDTQ